MIHLEVDCVTPLQLLYARYAETMDINGHLGKCALLLNMTHVIHLKML